MPYIINVHLMYSFIEKHYSNVYYKCLMLSYFVTFQEVNVTENNTAGKYDSKSLNKSFWKTTYSIYW